MRSISMYVCLSVFIKSDLFRIVAKVLRFGCVSPEQSIAFTETHSQIISHYRKNEWFDNEVRGEENCLKIDNTILRRSENQQRFHWGAKTGFSCHLLCIEKWRSKGKMLRTTMFRHALHAVSHLHPRFVHSFVRSTWQSRFVVSSFVPPQKCHHI